MNASVSIIRFEWQSTHNWSSIVLQYIKKICNTLVFPDNDCFSFQHRIVCSPRDTNQNYTSEYHLSQVLMTNKHCCYSSIGPRHNRSQNAMILHLYGDVACSLYLFKHIYRHPHTVIVHPLMYNYIYIANILDSIIVFKVQVSHTYTWLHEHC